MGFWRSRAGRRPRRGRDGDEDAGRRAGLLGMPRAVLVVSVLAIAALGVLGAGVEGKLSPTSLEIPGTESSRANQLLDDNFGESAPFVILLRGPGPALERQGPSLIRSLREDPRVTTLSPWDRGSVRRLRPSPREAIVIADFHVGIDEAVNETVPRLDRVLERKIRPPVRATQTGYATLSRAIQEDSIEATERGELIALPVLLLVLLLVFRSPVAALVPLAFGAATVIASRGLLSLVADSFSVDAFALTVCTMMGLALGVDYALLMVSRFREELAAGAAPADAARATRRTAGRTTAFAGSTLMLSMAVAFFIVPGSLLGSLAATLLLVVALSVLFAIVPLPALLVLLGPRIDRWRIGPAPGEGRGRLMAVVGAALRRPALAAAVIGILLLVLAAPAVGLKTGPPSQAQLPADDPVREDFERIEAAIGPGYDAPFVVVAAAPRGPITTERRLGALSRWQRQVAELPGVQTVVGPAQVNEAVRPVREADQLVGNALEGVSFEGLDQLRQLGLELGRAANGVAELREGVAAASFGAGLLAEGSGNAERGARMLAGGLARAGGGAQRAVAALDTFASGTRRLADAQQRAAIAGLQLKFGLQSVGPNLQQNGLRRARGLKKLLEEEVEETLPKLEAPAASAEDSLEAALEDLEGMTVGTEDPEYDDALDAVGEALAAVSGTEPGSGEPYAPEYEGLPDELAALRERLESDSELTNQVISWIESSIFTLNQLSNGADRLSEGLLELEEGGERLAAGAERLARSSTGLEDGVERLEAGAEALARGLDRLTGGAGALEESLAAGYREALPLQTGLSEASVQVISTDEQVRRRVGSAKRRVDRVRRQARRLQRTTPGLFDSGYFVLSALDGARPALRERAATAIDIENGGQAAQMLVISRYTFNSPGSRRLNRRLDRRARALGEATGLETGVAGGAAQLNDYSTVTAERIPWVVAAITLATFLVLILVLRSIPLAAIAVALNLATVAVAFGVLTLLFDLPEDWPLGGRTYVDAVGATAIFGVVFGLSIDYAVFLLMRMREHYDRHGDNAAAVEFGLARTARVITGAAAIMMAVFVAFAGAPIATVSQLGVGLTVAVLLDATVVRIVLLPALMLLLGDRVWWLPGPLRRALPRLDV